MTTPDSGQGPMATLPESVGLSNTSIPGANSKRFALARSIATHTTARLGMFLLLVVFCLSIFGPYLAPHEATEVVSLPFSKPGPEALLGTDYLGRDVLTRLLNGGRLILVVAVVVTAGAYTLGAPIGLITGYRRGRIDTLAVIVLDVFLSVPPIILSLLLIVAFGGSVVVAALAILVSQLFPVARLVRAFTLNASGTDYVEAALTRGESTWFILGSEILPNLRAPILADVGVRMAWSIMLYASLSFLGFGQSPEIPNWGQMISENQQGMLIQPFAVVAPVLCIGVLTVGLNMVSDVFARSTGDLHGGARGR